MKTYYIAKNAHPAKAQQIEVHPKKTSILVKIDN